MEETTKNSEQKVAPAVKQRSADKRASILDGARKVFLEEGYQRASMDRIAQEAGVSKQTIYAHFKDKQTLFNALLDELRLKFCLKDIAINVLMKEPKEFLTTFADAFTAQFDDPTFLGMQRLLVEESQRNPELARGFVESVIEPGMTMMSSYLSLHPKIKVSDPDATARVFFSALAGFMHEQRFLSGEKVNAFDRRRFTDRLITALLAAG